MIKYHMTKCYIWLKIGAKVLHSKCVEIGKKYNVPIIVKSTFKDVPGTIVE